MTAVTPADDRSAHSSVRLARSGALSLVGAVVNALAGFLLTLVVSRLLGAAEAGIFAVLVSASMVVMVSGKLGTDTALVHVLPRLLELDRAGEVRAAVRAAVVPVGLANALLAVVIALRAEDVAALLLPGADPQVVVPSIRWLALALPMGTLTVVVLAGTRGLGRIAALVGVESIGKPALRCLAVLVVLLLGGGAGAAVLAWAAPTVLGLAVAAAALLRAMPRGRSRGSTQDVRAEVWRFALPRAGAAVLEIVGLQVGVLLLGALADPADAGVYNAAARLVMVGTLLQQSLRLVVAPAISRLLVRGEAGEVEVLHRSSTVWILLTSWPLYVVMAVWADLVMGLFGSEFTRGAAALVVLAVGMLVNLGTGNVQTVVLMSGRSGANLGITVGSVTLNVGLCLLLIPGLGPLGAALARTAALVFENAAAVAVVRRGVGVRTGSRALAMAAALSCLAFAGPALLARGLGSVSLAAALGCGVVSTLLYLAGIAALRRPLAVAALLDLARRSARRDRGPAPDPTQEDVP